MKSIIVESKEAVAYVDGPVSFFPTGASLSGIDLRFLFWMDSENTACAIRATELLIASNLFGLVVLDPPKGSTSATSCRRLHLKLLHSNSRFVLLDKDDLSLPIYVHRKLHLQGRRFKWDGDDVGSGISGFTGRGQPSLSGGKQLLSSRIFYSGGE